jgi:hypothetical protein
MDHVLLSMLLNFFQYSIHLTVCQYFYYLSYKIRDKEDEGVLRPTKRPGREMPPDPCQALIEQGEDRGPQPRRRSRA